MMDGEELCRKCRNPAKNYASNMTRDNYGEWIRCSRCVEAKRQVDIQRAEWNRRVVGLVQKLDPDLQDYYEYDLAHGTLRGFLLNMRESGRSPADAVRSWRHKVMYLDATQAMNERKTTRQRRSSSQFQIKLDMVPQRQYKQPSEMPLVIAPPMDVVMRPPLPVIFAKPTQIVSMSNSLQRTYFPTDSEGDDFSDTTSESSDASFHGRVSGVVKDRNGRVAVVVTDSRGNRAKGRSVLAYFAT